MPETMLMRQDLILTVDQDHRRNSGYGVLRGVASISGRILRFTMCLSRAAMYGLIRIGTMPPRYSAGDGRGQVGDTVMVTNGVYNSGGKVIYGSLTNRIAIDKPITVRSVNGPNVTAIKGQGPLGDAAVRCAYVGPNACLEGFTLSNGCTKTDIGSIGEEQSGGGAWCEPSGLISNCIVTGNAAHYWGGGVCSFGVVRNCFIVSNSATRYGGGVGGEGLVSYCEIWNNRAGQDGGGVDNGTVEYCKVWGNAANYGGGADGSIVRNSVLWGNKATNKGGGVNDGIVMNCVIASNNAYTGGGVEGSTLDNCTLAGNIASYGGGAYYGVLNNCIIYSNIAPSGANYFNGALNYCCTTPKPGGTGNITNEPMFVDVRRQFPSVVQFALHQRWDKSGLDDRRDGSGRNPRIRGGRVDMGAYEYGYDPLCLAGAVRVAVGRLG